MSVITKALRLLANALAAQGEKSHESELADEKKAFAEYRVLADWTSEQLVDAESRAERGVLACRSWREYHTAKVNYDFISAGGEDAEGFKDAIDEECAARALLVELGEMVGDEADGEDQVVTNEAQLNSLRAFLGDMSTRFPVSRAIERIRDAEANVLRYGDHDRDCLRVGEPCHCGFSDASRAVREAQKNDEAAVTVVQPQKTE